MGRTAVDTLLFPTAVYHPDVVPENNEGDCDEWQQSRVNPVSRIDSLDPIASPTWDSDGAPDNRHVIWALPRFARNKPPRQIDVWWDEGSFSPSARRALDPNSFYRLGKKARGATDLSKHLLRALEHWSSQVVDFEKKYLELPFGSQIVISSIECDVRAMKISLVPEYDFEQQWLSVRELSAASGVPMEEWPQSIGLESLRLQERLGESTYVVGLDRAPELQLYIFKSATFDSKARYLELLNLLWMESHPHVQEKPLFIVQKRIRFGGKRGVCGFISEYHPLGTLGCVLSGKGLAEIGLETRLRWAREVTEALIHVRDSAIGFYPDLKIDNVVASVVPGGDGGLASVHAKLIDFEDGTPWIDWAPPEVYLVDFVDRVARAEVGVSFKRECELAMSSLLPVWKPPDRRARFKAGYRGYNPAWTHLTSEEKQSAMVYMLGKLFWYIFEDPGAMVSPVVPESFRLHPDTIAFPTFRHTPVGLRECIRKCTSGAREWEGNNQPFRIRGYKVVTCMEDGSNAAENPTRLQNLAREWWKEELAQAKSFINCRVHGPGAGQGSGYEKFHRKRPTLEEVLCSISCVKGSRT